MEPLGRPLYGVTFAGYAALVAWQAGSLPARVPAHLSFDGTVTRWSSLTEHLVLATAVGLLLLLLGPGLAVLMVRLPRSMVNVPHPEHWKREEHWPEALRRMTGALWSFGVLPNLFLIFTMGSVGETALGRPTPAWLFGAARTLFLAATAGWVAGLYRALRPPAEARLGAPLR